MHNGDTPLQLAISRNTEEQVAMALVEAGAETAGVRLSASLQRVAANVSVASVLSSYFADNVTPLMAAVRAPARAVAMHACVARIAIMHGSVWHQLATTTHELVCMCRHAVLRWAAACTAALLPMHKSLSTWMWSAGLGSVWWRKV
jgi:hypothetical protein